MLFLDPAAVRLTSGTLGRPREACSSADTALFFWASSRNISAVPAGSSPEGTILVLSGTPGGILATHPLGFAVRTKEGWALGYPPSGSLVFVNDEKVILQWNGAAWTDLGSAEATARASADTTLQNDVNTRVKARYGSWYGGGTVITTATVLAIGTDALTASGFTRSGNEVTASQAITAAKFSWSAGFEVTGTGSADFTVTLQVDTGGGFGTVAGTVRPASVEPVSPGKATIASSIILAVASGAKYRLVGDVTSTTLSPVVTSSSNGVSLSIESVGP